MEKKNIVKVVIGAGLAIGGTLLGIGLKMKAKKNGVHEDNQPIEAEYTETDNESEQ